MHFFKKQSSPQPNPRIDGLVAYYGLVDWWLSTFTQQDRDEIEFMQVPLGSDTRPLYQP